MSSIFIPRWKRFKDKKPSGPQEINQNHELAEGITRAYGVFSDAGLKLIDGLDNRHGEFNINTAYTSPEQGLGVRTATDGAVDLGSELYHSGQLSLVVGATVNAAGTFRQILCADSNVDGKRDFHLRLHSNKLMFLTFVGGSNSNALGSTIIDVGTRYVFGGTHDNDAATNNVRVFVDGVNEGTATRAGDLDADGAALTLGARNQRALPLKSYTEEADITYDFVWIYGDKYLTDGKHQALAEYPYQILKPRRSYWVMPEVGGIASYTLTADSGSYSLTGQAANLTKGSHLSLVAGSYSVTGQIAQLVKSSLLLLEAGAYSIAGSAANLILSNRLIAESGAYSITGQDVNLTKSLLLGIQSGAYLLSGQDAGLLKGSTISVDSGIYSVSGQNTGLLRNLILSPESGAYTLTGQAVNLVTGADAILAAGSGSYELTGNQAALVQSALISLLSGTYTLTGNSISLAIGQVLAADSGVYNLTGQQIGILHDILLDIESGTYDITGKSAGLNYSGATAQTFIMALLLGI